MRESVRKQNQSHSHNSSHDGKMTPKPNGYGRPFLQLQRTIGNHVVSRILGAPARIGPVDNPAEQEAKRDAPPALDPQEAASKGIAGTAGPLPHLEVVQRSFGDYDISSVKAHTDGQAITANRSLQSIGYTFGNHIAFAGTPDLHTAAHEAAHVVQQRGGVQLGGGMGQVGDQYEKHADAVADRVVAGKSVAALLGRFATAPVKTRSRSSFSGGHQLAIQRAPSKTAWTKAEIKSIQVELIRLGLYRLTADGDLGEGTQSALVEAFGGDEWTTLTGAVALTRLKAAAKPAGGKPGEHRFRYGEMFKDGLLDITLGLGFDEGKAHVNALKTFEVAMATNKFKEDAAVAADLYKKAGRAIGKSAFGRFFVRKDALSYTPPAGNARNIHAVVRLVHGADGTQGKEVATAFKEGLIQSDVAYYSGHGRYGSGLDFDRNYTFKLLDKNGKLEQKVDDYDDLEGILKTEGKAQKRSAWEQFMWRVNNKRIEVIGSNEGNVMLNPQNLHPGEFGAKLMYWNLNQAAGKGSAPITGKSGDLSTKAAAAPDRKYRVVVFDGCRSVDYEKSIRATPGLDEKSTDMLGSSRTLNWGDEGPTLVEFLDRIIKMQSAEEIVKNMDAQQHGGSGAYHGYGISENPVVK
jgi:hypothetical protein